MNISHFLKKTKSMSGRIQFSKIMLLKKLIFQLFKLNHKRKMLKIPKDYEIEKECTIILIVKTIFSQK